MSIRIRSFRSSAAAGVALGALMLAASPALAEKASLKAMSFDARDAAATIHVISTDKAKWNELKTGAVPFEAHMKIDTWHPGYVDDVAIKIGDCGLGACAGSALIWSDSIVKRDYQSTETVYLPAYKLAESGAGDQIIARCNEKLQADGPTKSHAFTHDVPLTFSADTEKKWGNIDNAPDEANLGQWPHSLPETDHERSDTLPVQVICDAVVKSPTNDLAHDFGAFDIENVKLFLTTYQSNKQGSNPGAVCPSLKVTSRAETNQAGPVTMRIWRQKDGGAITSDVVQAWASYNAAKNGYFATYEKWENVGTTSHFAFMTEIVENSPFAPTDGWKDITVHCTSPGGGGFTDGQDPDHDLPQPHAKWQGELTIADSAAADKSCPRQGQVFFAVTRPEPGDFSYRIQCSNGAFFTGTATGYDQGSGTFEAYGAHNISINRTRSISCTLQELTPAPVTVATDKQDFVCNNPAIDPDADDLTSVDQPDTATPVPPVVIDPPAPKCRPNERLVRGRCVEKPVAAACKSNEKLVGGKCIGVSIHCLRGYHQVGLKCVKNETPDVSILCKPGFVLNGKTCVRKPEVSILCKPGFVLNGKTCVRKPTIVTTCGRGEKLVRGNCVDVKPVTKLKRFAAPKRVVKQPAMLKALKSPKAFRTLRRN